MKEGISELFLKHYEYINKVFQVLKKALEAPDIHTTIKDAIAAQDHRESLWSGVR